MSTKSTPSISSTPKNWEASSRDFAEHAAHTQAAIALWLSSHPGQILDVTAAQAEYALFLGFPVDHFLLGRHGNWTDETIAQNMEISLKQTDTAGLCPVCGSRLGFEVLPSCPKVNPRRYTGLFFCESEDCGYHFYSKQGLLDLRSIVDLGHWDDLIRIMPE